ncbi:hypothetical protein ILYODFUR_021633 [Ilyodon furcidens]|uniref:Uncharacterized protein n=1 Tax=Ilyodon furcidens TaxID=33524 RepID=A0ABV0TWK2_9TELE
MVCSSPQVMFCCSTLMMKKTPITLLKHLDSKIHEASLSKFLFVQPQVTFLDHLISSKGMALSPERLFFFFIQNSIHLIILARMGTVTQQDVSRKVFCICSARQSKAQTFKQSCLQKVTFKSDFSAPL